MSNVHHVESTPHSRFAPDRSERIAPPRDALAPTGTEPAKADRVDISESARAASDLDARGVRVDLVSRVRSEIAAGTYVTSDKVDAAIDSLLAGFDD